MLEAEIENDELVIEVTESERRGLPRERLEGPASVRCDDPRLHTRASTVDLHEGGLTLLCARCPEVGAWLHIELTGVVIEGRVKHVAPEGVLWRVGVETP